MSPMNSAAIVNPNVIATVGATPAACNTYVESTGMKTPLTLSSDEAAPRIVPRMLSGALAESSAGIVALTSASPSENATTIATAVGIAWAPFPVPLAGHPYLARRVQGADLSDANPFTLLADGVPGARADMGHWTIVAAPTTLAGAPGFLLLADQLNPTTMDRASGEELQDHACAIKAGS